MDEIEFKIGEEVIFGPHKGFITGAVLMLGSKWYRVSYFNKDGHYVTSEVFWFEITKAVDKFGFNLGD